MKTQTKEMQASLTPTQAIELLMDGNKRFIGNLKLNRNLLQQVNETAEGQHPFAFILSCIDSRTSAELIFDQGLGDIFSCRIAGNVINEDILGSMEFACKLAGSKVIVVLGHTRCGAVKGACDNVKMGNLTGLLDKLKPVIEQNKNQNTNGGSHTYHYPDTIAKLNVKYVMEQIPEHSDILADMLAKGQIAIVGGLYEVETGKVEFYERPAGGEKSATKKQEFKVK